MLNVHTYITEKGTNDLIFSDYPFLIHLFVHDVQSSVSHCFVLPPPDIITACSCLHIVPKWRQLFQLTNCVNQGFSHNKVNTQ